MAIVTYVGKRQFAEVVPGNPSLILFEWPSNDESIWKRVSGDWTEINETCYILFRHAGVLYLRTGTIDTELDEKTTSTLSLEGDHLRLRIHCKSGTFNIVESFPKLLRDDPILDHIQCEEYLWTYRVNSVLSDPDGRRTYWRAER
jgi:hypothetical protein